MRHSADASADRSTHLAERAIQFIEDGIRNGHYVPGQRLVEATVAADSGLGIGSVREAIRFLAGEGVLNLVPYRGATIKRLGRGEIISVLETLVGLGSVGLKLAAKQCFDKAQLASLRHAHKHIRETAESGFLAELFNAAENYHTLVHTLTANPYLNICIRRLHLNLFHRELAAALAIEKWDEHYKTTYRHITDAIETGDAHRAVALFEQHMEKLLGVVRRGLAGNKDHSDVKEAPRRNRSRRRVSDSMP